jgi:hypothetical protein
MYKVLVTTLWGEHVDVLVIEFTTIGDATEAVNSINKQKDREFRAGKKFNQTAVILP